MYSIYMCLVSQLLQITKQLFLKTNSKKNIDLYNDISIKLLLFVVFRMK